jgi:DNA repair protein RadC
MTDWSRDLLGSSIILIHNHPSGNINPSDQDISITKKIVEAGKLFDIAVLDHIIIGVGYYSLADEGTL